MDNQKFSNVLGFYLNHLILIEKERTGWIKWNVTGRRESVAEHISKVQALAWALYSEFDELSDVNIEHVNALLSVHEEGETIIGDITPYDGVTPEEKAKIERDAVVSIFKKLKKGGYLISLFDEFEARETNEAIFAYLCDKLDADLQAKFYSENERCSVENATFNMVNIPKIQEVLANGAKTVWDVFYETDKSKYEGTFLEDFFTSLRG